MAKEIKIYEADDGQRFETFEECEQHEAVTRQLYLKKLREEIGYTEVPLFEERRYGAYIVSPVTILTATPRSMKELEDIAEFMRQEISPELVTMPGFQFDPATKRKVYVEPAAFPMVYSVMIERFRKRKHPIVKLFTGKEFANLANLITGHVPDLAVASGVFEDEHASAPYAPAAPPAPESEPKPVVVMGFAGEETTPKKKRGGAREVRYVTVGETTKTLTEWSRDSGIAKSTILNRICTCGWDPVRAVTEPVRFR